MGNIPAILLAFLLLWTSVYSRQEEYGSEYTPNLKEWEYSMSVTINSSGNTYNGKVMVSSSGEEVINGKTYTKSAATMSEFALPMPSTPNFYSRVTRTGKYIISEDHRNFPETLQYPFPLKVGTTWTRVTFNGKQKCRVEAIEDVVLPDKTYERCIKISFQSKNKKKLPSGVEYLAKGIGIVKIIMNFKDGSATDILLRYSK